MLFHICRREEWDQQKPEPDYRPSTFEKEGFIHCCLQGQLEGVRGRYFRNINDLLLLVIDDQMLTSPVKFEASVNGEQFPHVFGPINKTAIVEIKDIADV
jgi:uncharacterized protein (DUF952 family)